MSFLSKMRVKKNNKNNYLILVEKFLKEYKVKF